MYDIYYIFVNICIYIYTYDIITYIYLHDVIGHYWHPFLPSYDGRPHLNLALKALIGSMVGLRFISWDLVYFK